MNAVDRKIIHEQLDSLIQKAPADGIAVLTLKYRGGMLHQINENIEYSYLAERLRIESMNGLKNDKPMRVGQFSGEDFYGNCPSDKVQKCFNSTSIVADQFSPIGAMLTNGQSHRMELDPGTALVEAVSGGHD